MLTGVAVLLAAAGAAALAVPPSAARVGRHRALTRLPGRDRRAAVGGGGRRAVPRRRAVVALAARVRPVRPLPLVDVLDALAGSLRTGASVATGLAEARAVAPPGVVDELDVVLAEVALGATVVDALRSLARRRPQPGLHQLAAAVALGRRGGGDLARAVEAVAASERQRLAARSEVLAQSAQARLSAVVVAVAPVAFTAVAGAAEPGVGAFLLGRPAGWACLAGGLLLDVVGGAWMVHIARSVA